MVDPHLASLIWEFTASITVRNELLLSVKTPCLWFSVTVFQKDKDGFKTRKRTPDLIFCCHKGEHIRVSKLHLPYVFAWEGIEECILFNRGQAKEEKTPKRK